MSALELSLDDLPEKQRKALERAFKAGYTVTHLIGTVSSRNIFWTIQAEIRTGAHPDTGHEIWMRVDDSEAPWNKIT